MPPDLNLYLMAAAVLLSSAALVAQAISAYKTYQVVKKLSQEIKPLIPKAREAVENASVVLTEAREQLAAISQRSNEILDTARIQLMHFDAARGEVTERFKAQLERAELVIDDTLSRFQDVVGTAHRGVMRPVREVSGIMAGLKAGVQALRTGRRPSVAEATSDEEMFI